MPLHVVIPVFPGVTQLDFTGPAQIFAFVPEVSVHIVAESLEPILTDSGFSVGASRTFWDCPDADVLCIPGGPGVLDAIKDRELCRFVEHQARTASYVTSVCTGMFVLGSLGLLKGKRVTSHWGYTKAIEVCGAVCAPGRVVTDGRYITAGGVTAGIDFALSLISELFGEDLAKRVQLRIEYDPHPPFDSGHPSRAAKSTLSHVQGFYREASERMINTLEKVISQSPAFRQS